MILTVAVVIALIVAVVFEGRVIGICLRAVGNSGPARLTALGSNFLASEVWVVALLGLAHGAYADLLHVLMGDGALGFIGYVAGWMLRDLGLWIGPRTRGQRRARWCISIGAALQIGGAIVFVMAALRNLSDLAQAASVPDSATLLAIIVIPVLVIGTALQVALVRLPSAPYFDWARRRDPYAV